MKNSDQIRGEVEKTLQAFDHDLPLKPNPFLFTRIQAERIARAPDLAKAAFWQGRLRQVVILGILLLNLITVIHYADWNAKLTTSRALASELETEFVIGSAAGEF